MIQIPLLTVSLRKLKSTSNSSWNATLQCQPCFWISTRVLSKQAKTKWHNARSCDDNCCLLISDDIWISLQFISADSGARFAVLCTFLSWQTSVLTTWITVHCWILFYLNLHIPAEYDKEPIDSENPFFIFLLPTIFLTFFLKQIPNLTLTCLQL